jgi:hypothetical protein
LRDPVAANWTLLITVYCLMNDLLAGQRLREPPVKMGRSLMMGMVLPGGSDPEPP